MKNQGGLQQAEVAYQEQLQKAEQDLNLAKEDSGRAAASLR